MTNGNGNSHTTTGREKNENGGNAAASIQKAYEIAHDPHPMSKTEAQVFGVLGLIFVGFVGFVSWADIKRQRNEEKAAKLREQLRKAKLAEDDDWMEKERQAGNFVIKLSNGDYFSITADAYKGAKRRTRA